MTEKREKDETGPELANEYGYMYICTVNFRKLLMKAEAEQRLRDDAQITNANPKRTHDGVGEYVPIE